jgi:hypothetical protein
MKERVNHELIGINGKFVPSIFGRLWSFYGSSGLKKMPKERLPGSSAEIAGQSGTLCKWLRSARLFRSLGSANIRICGGRGENLDYHDDCLCGALLRRPRRSSCGTDICGCDGSREAGTERGIAGGYRNAFRGRRPNRAPQAIGEATAREGLLAADDAGRRFFLQA